MRAAAIPLAARPRRWLLVAGCFDSSGGMDQLNASLAAHLARSGDEVHIVAHRVDPELAARRGVTIHSAALPAASFLLGEVILSRTAAVVAARLAAQDGGVRVVANGGNCMIGDINWVHYVHRDSARADRGAPVWFRAKNTFARSSAVLREARAIRRARLVIANSERTRRDLIARLAIPDDRIQVIYPGISRDAGLPSAERRALARCAFGITDARPIVAFVGALGYDARKGFDTMLEAWRILNAASPGWDATLVAAGGGRGWEMWKRRVEVAGLSGSVRMLGYTTRVPELLDAADLLISPVRYESYGMNVHEALCAGVPAMVSRAAGVADRFPVELDAMLVDDPEDARALAEKMRAWRGAVDHWRRAVEPASRIFREWTIDDMARTIADAAAADIELPESH